MIHWKDGGWHVGAAEEVQFAPPHPESLIPNREIGYIAAATSSSGLIEIREHCSDTNQQRIVGHVTFGGGEHYVPLVGKQIRFTRSECGKHANDVRPPSMSAAEWEIRKGEMLNEFRAKVSRQNRGNVYGYDGYDGIVIGGIPSFAP